ncbi:AAA family ATPase [bacterium]|nr:AAA family ATPase [bacterium]
MKIKRVNLNRFKRFRDCALEFDIGSDPNASVVTVLVGSNGSGKSSVLQAIAATLGSATRRLRFPRDLEWPGFNPELLNSAWNGPFEVRLDVHFSDDEIRRTSELFEKFAPFIDKPELTEPARSQCVKLYFREDGVTAPTASELFQFRGREYAKFLFSNNVVKFDVFEDVGSTLWYTENRTSTSLTAESDSISQDDRSSRLEFDEDKLRRQLNALHAFHERVVRGHFILREGQRDILGEFEKFFKLVFPRRRLSGPVPRSQINQVMDEPWFKLFDDAHEYDISEMSGAERALFPMLFDFANWNINNSVILIDEIELHLHPPLQQRLLSALVKFGKNNHFIISTHSDWVMQLLSPVQIIRLDKGDA